MPGLDPGIQETPKPQPNPSRARNSAGSVPASRRACRVRALSRLAKRLPFCGLKRLVYMEPYEEITTAIQREKNLKHWSRDWKIQMIEKENPGWEDLYDRIL